MPAPVDSAAIGAPAAECDTCFEPVGGCAEWCPMKDDTAPAPAISATPNVPAVPAVEQDAAIPDLGLTMGEAVGSIDPIGSLDGGAAYADYVDDDEDVC